MSFLFRCIIGFMLLCLLVGGAGQCAQTAPQLANNAAAGIGQAAGSAVGSLLSSATQAVTCSLPFVNCAPAPGGEVFAQCLAPNGRPSPRCTSYASVDDAAAAALVLARIGTKCSGLEFAGVIYARNVGGIRKLSFVGPFQGNTTSADFTVSVTVLQKLGVAEADVAGIYHSHPSNSSTMFSLGDMVTAVKFHKPSYIVGTNFGGDGEVVRFTPTTPTAPAAGWDSGWVWFREVWYDMTSSPLGNTVPLGDLGSNGELVNPTQQCPTQAL